MKQGYLSGQQQSQSEATLSAMVGGAIKGLEDLFAFIGRDQRAAILHGQLQ